MKLNNLLVYIILVVSTGSIFAQSEQILSSEKYNSIYDSLTIVKRSLTLEKETLISEIDSLLNHLDEMKERIVSARSGQLIKKYGKTNGTRIAQGQVWKGMSEKMLEDSWGKPDKITKNKEKWGLFTQWYYGDITYFFKDRIMTGWEEIK